MGNFLSSLIMPNNVCNCNLVVVQSAQLTNELLSSSLVFFFSSSFTVALKSLKPFDTEEEDELVVSFARVLHTT